MIRFPLRCSLAFSSLEMINLNLENVFILGILDQNWLKIKIFSIKYSRLNFSATLQILGIETTGDVLSATLKKKHIICYLHFNIRNILRGLVCETSLYWWARCADICAPYFFFLFLFFSMHFTLWSIQIDRLKII